MRDKHNIHTGALAEDLSRDDLPTAEENITISVMGIDDLAAVFHLGEMIFTSDKSPMLYRTWDPYEVTGMFQTDPETCFVARNRAGSLVGFVLGTIIEKGTAWTYGYIVWLGIHPDWQRRKVGDRLMTALERQMTADGVRMFLADTSADNKGAIRFFENCGFRSREKHLYLWKTLRGDAEARQKHVWRTRSEDAKS